MSVIKLNEMKERIEELVTRVQAGETILIEKDGQTVARLEGMAASSPERRKKIDITALQEFTRSLQPAEETGADLIRRMRDDGY
jgi:antitoxin (DNA-binding transcriptional repressor) of toxin-antitoxin stability system